MNNYPYFKNYDYNNQNMISNQKFEFDNFKNNQNGLYDAYNGLIRGNIFKKLYDPYLTSEPYEIKPMNEQAELLTKIDALSFAMVDLGLYLDINPNNQDMISLYNKYREEKLRLINEYESRYEPITLDSNKLDTFPWSWDEMPWPWDN